MRRWVSPSLPWILAAVCCLSAGRASAAEVQADPHDTIVRATSQAPDIPGQARALRDLAWPLEGPRDPAVQAEARRELINYGEFALHTLREAIKTRDPLWHADITASFIEAAHTISAGQPADLLPGLDEMIWFGSPEARRLAIHEMGRYKFPPAVLPIIDAVKDSPLLTIAGVRALGQMGDPRSRFFLGGLLVQGQPREQREAAAALQQLDDSGLIVLRQSARSSSRPEREAAFRALLTAAQPEDADLFHRYALQHPEDDPTLLRRVQARAAELEQALEQQRDSSAPGVADDGQDP